MRSGRIVALYGAGSGSGKTALAEALLRRLPGWAAMKVAPSAGPPVVAREAGAGDPDKDTARLRAAGADPVVLVRAPAAGLADGLRQALALIPAGRPLLVEGRAAVDYLRPDLGILVWRPGHGRPKGSLSRLLPGADILFCNLPPGGEAPEERVPPGIRVVRGCLDPGSSGEGVAEVLEIMSARGIR